MEDNTEIIYEKQNHSNDSTKKLPPESINHKIQKNTRNIYKEPYDVNFNNSSMAEPTPEIDLWITMEDAKDKKSSTSCDQDNSSTLYSTGDFLTAPEILSNKSEKLEDLKKNNTIAKTQSECLQACTKSTLNETSLTQASFNEAKTFAFQDSKALTRNLSSEWTPNLKSSLKSISKETSHAKPSIEKNLYSFYPNFTHQHNEILQTYKPQPTKPKSIHIDYNSQKKRLEEDENSPAWYKHKLHVFIFTYSGKPVYSRYGSEERLSAFTGTLSAIITTMQSLFLLSEEQDELRYIKAGNHTFAFLQRGPLWLTAISSHGEVYNQLEALLNNVHLQIISLLTRSVDNVLTHQPSFDLRQLLGGTEQVIFNYISWHCKDMFSLVQGYEPLPLNPNSRSIALNILKDVRSPNLLASILIAQHRIIAITTSKSINLLASDIALLVNLVLSSTSLRQAESWTPVCLPGINDGGFLYAYINFLSSDTVGLISISSNSDGEQFYLLSEHFKRISQLMSTSNCLKQIHDSINFCPYPIDESLENLGITHLLCFSTELQQYFSSKIYPDYYSCTQPRRIVQLYSRCNYLIRGMTIPSFIQINGQHESAYLLRTSEYHLYVFSSRWKEVTTMTLNQILEWIKGKINFLYIVSIPILKS